MAVVEVAKKNFAPIKGDSRPEAKVEVALEVATNAPAVKGSYFKALLKVPEVVMVPPCNPVPAVMEVTVPPLLVTRQEPLTTTQPPERTRPLAKVLEAVPVWFRAKTFKPPAKEEVAVEEVALKVEAAEKPPTTRLRMMSTRPLKVEVAVVEVAR